MRNLSKKFQTESSYFGFQGIHVYSTEEARTLQKPKHTSQAAGVFVTVCLHGSVVFMAGHECLENKENTENMEEHI
ncbi:hypothetical protein SUGI_1131500 [Cryptomeria japonica]|nr:hypothetical protein SUGI_1131500 [Cryptomeria japonica]